VRAKAFFAVKTSDSEKLEECCDAAPDLVKRQDKDSNTLLHYAMFCSSTACIHMLICKGADTNIPNKAGLTPQNLALRAEQRGLIHRQKLLCDPCEEDSTLLIPMACSNPGCNATVVDDRSRSVHDIAYYPWYTEYGNESVKVCEHPYCAPCLASIDAASWTSRCRVCNRKFNRWMHK
jgi:hypothetical protein